MTSKQPGQEHSQSVSGVINSCVDPVVDSLSQLVMDCISGDVTDEHLELHQSQLALSLQVCPFIFVHHCTNLFDQNLATTAQAAARSLVANDMELVADLTNGIKKINAAVVTFCNGFQGYIESPDSLEHHQFFTTAGKEVAEALHNLVQVVDDTSELRVKRVTDRTTMALAEVILQIKAEYHNKSSMNRFTAAFEQESNATGYLVLFHSHLIRPVTLCMNILSKTTLGPKKALLNKCFDILEYSAPRMLDCARRLANNSRTYLRLSCE